MGEHHYFASVVGPNKPLMQCKEEAVRSVGNRGTLHSDIYGTQFAF